MFTRLEPGPPTARARRALGTMLTKVKPSVPASLVLRVDAIEIWVDLNMEFLGEGLVWSIILDLLLEMMVIIHLFDPKCVELE